MSNLQLRHRLPHRIRLDVLAVRHDSNLARSLEKRCKDMEGTLSTRVNERCGSLVIRYDPMTLDESELIDFVHQLVSKGG